MQIKPLDRTIYQRQLADFLPARIIDIHTHVWKQSFLTPEPHGERGAQWASKVAAEIDPEELVACYGEMLPQQQVTPLLFGMPGRNVDTDANNAWVSQKASDKGFPALLISKPELPPQELERQVAQGGFLGLKPYLEFAPPHLASDQITIFDFLPPAHLEMADAHGWIVMLHIPRSGRLKDPLNLAQMLEIEQKYPHIRLIIAHIGRAYCPADMGNAFEVLQGSQRISFDFSANTNTEVMVELIRAVGSRRILFGSDMPITRMRMRRICERGVYINLVPPGLYGDLSQDPHMREVSPAEAGQLSFFLYEEILAFRRAAEITHLSVDEIDAVFYGNARCLIEGQE
jgi:predicted TIM-barrel fold metal-dependent hydrolase